MDAYDLFIAADEQAVTGFGVALADRGVPPSRIEQVLEYSRLSLMPRDNDDPDDFSKSDWRLYCRMEDLREMLGPTVILSVDELLQDWVSQKPRHFTINARLDDYIVPPRGPLVSLEQKKAVEEDDEIWRGADVAPAEVLSSLRYKQ